jgi:hypothetical protein
MSKGNVENFHAVPLKKGAPTLFPSLSSFMPTKAVSYLVVSEGNPLKMMKQKDRGIRAPEHLIDHCCHNSLYFKLDTSLYFKLVKPLTWSRICTPNQYNVKIR